MWLRLVKRQRARVPEHRRSFHSSHKPHRSQPFPTTGTPLVLTIFSSSWRSLSTNAQVSLFLRLSTFLRLDVRYSWQLFSPLMKQTLRYVFPLVALILILAHRSPAPIIYREGEGFLPGGAEDIEIKKNAQDQFDLAQRYEDRRDWAHAGASYRMVVRRFPRADIAPAALFNSGRM